MEKSYELIAEWFTIARHVNVKSLDRLNEIADELNKMGQGHLIPRF